MHTLMTIFSQPPSNLRDPKLALWNSPWAMVTSDVRETSTADGRRWFKYTSLKSRNARCIHHHISIQEICITLPGTHSFHIIDLHSEVYHFLATSTRREVMDGEVFDTQDLYLQQRELHLHPRPRNLQWNDTVSLQKKQVSLLLSTL